MNHKPVVLVVDDRPENLLTVEAVLQPLDVTVQTSIRAEAALQFLLDHDVAVILLDVEMPDIDGFETARLIRQRPRSHDTPIIFVTAVERGNSTVRQGYELGAVDYIVKPFQPDVLRWKVSVFAELYRSRQKERVLVEEQTKRIAMETTVRRASVLAEVSGALGSSLNRSAVLKALAPALAPAFVDCAVVFMRESGTVRPYSVAGACAEQIAFSETDALPYQTGDPLFKAAADPAPVVIDDLTCLGDTALELSHRRFLEQGTLRSGVFVPIQRGTEIIGVLALYLQKSQPFDSTTAFFLRELRDRIALGLTNIALYEESERANHAKDEFLAMVSHELRTPLVTIAGWSDVLLSKQLPPERVQAALRTIQKSARLQNELISDILDFSRIATGRFSIHFETVDLKTILEESIDALRPLAETKGIDIVQRIGEERPSVAGDPKRLQQLFSNLLSNAIKFTPARGQVTVAANKTEQRSQVLIQDSGIGIAAEFLPHVFEPFVQADGSNTRAYSGLGLGLAIAHRLVELHGGEIRVESDGPGRGTVVTIDFPAPNLQLRAS